MSRPRFLADHNFNQDIVDGLTRREPAILIMLASEVDMQESSDPELLEFAARADLLVLTHDLKTMPGHAYERVAAGQPMPGVIAIRQSIGIGRAIEFLLEIWSAGNAQVYRDQVIYQPTRITP